jgi:lambda repressor-like predicted transcriptional regulator
MVRKRELFRIAEKLRRKGWSYSEINKQVGISKSTLSSWFSDKKWSQLIRDQLVHMHKEKNVNRLVQINKSRTLQTLQRHDQYRKEAKLEFETLKNNPLFLVGLSIYWGEGEKIGKGRVSVINTDVNMLQVVANFYRHILRIPNHKLRAALFIYKDINQSTALKFWSEKLGLPKSQFIKTQVLPGRSRLAKRRSINGICNLYFSSTEMSIKIGKWIRLLALEMRE